MRESASGIFAVVILAVVLIWVMVLAGYSLTESTDYIAGEEGEPRLYFIWRSLVWFVDGGDGVARIFAGLVAIVGVCVQTLAKLHRSTASVVAITVACLAGIIACVVVMMATGERGGPVIRSLRATVGGSEEALRGSIQLFMGLIFVWFASFAGTQLGISLVKKNGALRAVVDRVRRRRGA